MRKMAIRTDLGSRKWLLTKDWSDVGKYLQHIKNEGYQIVSTVPNANLKLADVDFTQRLVVAFGNEHAGVSDSVLEASKYHVSIPMIGFVQSLNLSVCVAITLHHAYTQRMEKLVREQVVSTEILIVLEQLIRSTCLYTCYVERVTSVAYICNAL